MLSQKSSTNEVTTSTSFTKLLLPMLLAYILATVR
nr:MAG TPA: hypothetical protein [Caudoviricetes sp.]